MPKHRENNRSRDLSPPRRSSATVGAFESKWAHELAAEIISGVVGGVAVPIRWRWLILYQKWAILATTGSATGFAVAVINIVIARHAIDEGVAALAYLLALMGACIAAGWLVAGFVEGSYLRSILRQAEAD